MSNSPGSSNVVAGVERARLIREKAEEAKSALFALEEALSPTAARMFDAGTEHQHERRLIYQLRCEVGIRVAPMIARALKEVDDGDTK